MPQTILNWINKYGFHGWSAHHRKKIKFNFFFCIFKLHYKFKLNKRTASRNYEKLRTRTQNFLISSKEKRNCEIITEKIDHTTQIKTFFCIFKRYYKFLKFEIAKRRGGKGIRVGEIEITGRTPAMEERKRRRPRRQKEDWGLQRRVEERERVEA